MYNFDPYNVLLAIATNIPVLLMTAFVLQDHIQWRSGRTCTAGGHHVSGGGLVIRRWDVLKDDDHVSRIARDIVKSIKYCHY